MTINEITLSCNSHCKGSDSSELYSWMFLEVFEYFWKFFGIFLNLFVDVAAEFIVDFFVF